ncbi:phage tail protein [Laribacter hongkongensis]|uniref:phage tail protein n=1 Tax=Laribacter hongkongensis TaxID=168471 RepID=UPI001EFE1EBB|nr:phage tail protein [Laribacter hongkongensis]MCG9033284.1 phage tail protein [Laribacter hongkongensis]MCG9093372.1 phage tail protein [Laribacter hongkongensis]
MALKEYVGATAVEIDGRDYDVVSFSVKRQTGRKIVKTMNRTGRAAGTCRGVETYEINLTAAIPVNEDPDWIGVLGAKMTTEPIGGGKRKSYLDCVVIDQSEKYTVDNEAQIDVNMIALRCVEE